MIYLGADDLWFRSLDDCGYGQVEVDILEEIVTCDPYIMSRWTSSGYTVTNLSLKLKLPAGLGVYEIFSYFFAGNVNTDFDMLNAIFRGLLLEPVLCFCFHVKGEFCWFSSDLKILGRKVFKGKPSMYNLGYFYKSLQYDLAVSGCRVAKFYGDNFSRYIQATPLETLLWGMPLEEAFFILSRNIGKMTFSCSELIDLLKQSRVVLGYSDSGLRLKRSYQKNFSACYSSVIGHQGTKYGIIVDCEGKQGGSGSLNDGCRELGGVIYGRYKDIVVCLDSFSCDDILFEDTMLRVIENYKSFHSGDKTINVLTFGSSDAKMLSASIASCSRRSRDKFKVFQFVDCKKYIEVNTPEHEGRGTLANMARALDVMVLTPVHKPLNDAKTLFNVLAMILHRTGDFPVL